MKNRIEKELIKDSQNYLAFYQLHNGTMQCSCSGLSPELMENIMLAFYENSALMELFQAAIKLTKEIIGEEKAVIN
jgi:hypothetical protein